MRSFHGIFVVNRKKNLSVNIRVIGDALTLMQHLAVNYFEKVMTQISYMFNHTEHNVQLLTYICQSPQETICKWFA